MVARADALTLTQAYGVGRGTVEPVLFATPAAGAHFSRTTGQGYFERYLSLAFTLTADANVANRIVSVEIQDADGNTLGGAAYGFAQTATNVFKYYAGIGQSENTTALARAQTGLPWIFVQPGWKMVDTTQGIQVGDTFTAIRAVVERFGIGPDGTPVGETAEIYTERGRGYERALESE